MIEAKHIHKLEVARHHWQDGWTPRACNLFAWGVFVGFVVTVGWMV